MSGNHSSSRRRSYGRRQSEVRRRRGDEVSFDVDGPASWPRGAAWEAEPRMPSWRGVPGAAEMDAEGSQAGLGPR
jgi:hypothetical protein